MRKIAIASRILALSGAGRLIRGLTAGNGSVRVLTYHRILDLPQARPFGFDTGLISASRKEFEWQMRYVKRRFHPISLALLDEIVRGHEKTPRNAVLVTFDDGFDDNYYHALPILSDCRVPAAWFVSTGYIERGEIFWFDWLAFIVNNMPNGILRIEGWRKEPIIDSSRESRRHAFGKVMRFLSQVGNEKRLAVLQQIDDAYGYLYREAGDDIRSMSRPMNWAQLREAVDAGIEVGSHSISHPFLTRVTGEELLRELVESKRTLERQLGKNIFAISYPNGSREDFDARVIKAVKEAGYTLGLSYVHGVHRSRLPNLNPFGLQRLHVSPVNDRYVFAGTLSCPQMFSL